MCVRFKADASRRTGRTAGTEEKLVSMGGVKMMSESEVQVALARNGDVLLQIHRNLKMLLAAGYRAITPGAASAGDYGSVKFKKSGGGEETIRHHLTPEGADLHMVGALKGSLCIMTPDSQRRLVGLPRGFEYAASLGYGGAARQQHRMEACQWLQELKDEMEEVDSARDDAHEQACEACIAAAQADVVQAVV
jgi:hypothetical protein